MQKKLIALAVAGALVAPAAMAEVTISGGLQAEIVNVGGDGTTVPKGLYAMDGMERSGQNAGNFSFLKFAATEDLGGGMKALAQYNMNIAPDNVLGTRDTFVGLGGNWGTVLAGRLATPYKSSTVGWDPFLATALQARGNLGMSVLNNGYANNALAYANSFGGVKVVAAMVLDESKKPTDATKTNGKNAWSVSVNAPVGPVEIAAAYVDASEFSDVSQLGLASAKQVVNIPAVASTPIPATTLPVVTAGPTAAAKNATAAKIGVKWDGGPLTVAAQYENLDKGLTADGKSGSVIWASASYKLDDSNTLSLSGGETDKHANDGLKSGSYLAVGANHAFSKTTSAFVGYMNSDGGNKTDLNAISLGARVTF